MADRAAPAAASVRVDVLKELQQLIDNRDARDRLDRSAIAETKGREHWVLHLLLRAQESEQSHLDTLIGSAYSNLLSRLQYLEDRIGRIEELDATLQADLKARLEALDAGILERIDEGLRSGGEKLLSGLATGVGQNLDARWKPVGESIDAFVQGSRQISKDVSDTYRIATQTRLLLSENARRITDLGRDLLSLEEGLKVAVQGALEELLAPWSERLGAIEAQLGLPTPTNHRRPPAEAPAPAAPAEERS
jgi:hypothetical protein